MSRLTASTLTRIQSATGSLSRRKLIDSAKTFGIVVPMTLLIWVYAERAQLQPDSITLTLALVPADAGLTADIVSPSEGQVSVALSGPRGQLEQLKTKIASGTVRNRLPIALPSTYSDLGEKPIDLVQLLNDDPLIANSGVTVVKAGTSPGVIKVAVDQLITREATVVKPRDLPQNLENVTFDPPRVTFRGPAGTMDAQFPASDATVTVDLSSIRGQLTVGRNRVVEVPLVLPQGGRVTSTVQRVKMSFDLSSQEKEQKLLSVPIEIQRPLGQDGKSRVVMRRGAVVNNVRIKGPESKVDKYLGEYPELRLTAILQVTQADAGRGEITRAVQFEGLEPGVEVLDQPYEVSFEVQSLSETDR